MSTPLSNVVTRRLTAHRPLSGRAVRLAAAVLVAGLLGGCVPMMVAGLLLGGGERSAPGGSGGPFSGAPHSVQNAKPSTPGSDALSSVVDQPILDSCKEKLPDPPEALPSTGCSLRASCLAGMSTPMPLRVCALPPRTADPVRAPGATDES